MRTVTCGGEASPKLSADWSGERGADCRAIFLLIWLGLLAGCIFLLYFPLSTYFLYPVTVSLIEEEQEETVVRSAIKTGKVHEFTDGV